MRGWRLLVEPGRGSTVFVTSALTGCTLMDLARGFEGTDAGCWSDSGDVMVYAERTYAFPAHGPTWQRITGQQRNRTDGAQTPTLRPTT